MSAFDNEYEFFDELDAERPISSADLFFEDLMGKPLALRAREERYGPAIESAAAPATPIAVPAGFRMGVWLDVGGRSLVAQGARHAALLHELGFSDACIMINRFDARGFGFSAVSESTIRGFSALLAGSGTRLTLTSWLRPDKGFIDELVRLLPPLARDIGARAIELDVEGTWRSRSVRGFSNHAEAAEYFFNALRPASTGLEIAVTCEVDPMPSSRMQAVVQGADVVVPQAYSAYKSGRAHRIGGAFGPRGIQDRAVRKLAEAVRASGKPTVMGLAAYGRGRWPGSSANAIMRMELAHTLSLRSSATLLGARFWSWKHIAGLDARGGQPANRYALHFFRTSVSSPGAGGPSTAPAASPATPPVSRPASESQSELEYQPEAELANEPETGLEDELETELEYGPETGRDDEPEADLGYGPETGLEHEPEFGLVPGEGNQDIASPVTTDLRDEASTGRRQPSSPSTPPSGTPSRRERVLQTVRVELPLTRERIDAAKLYDPARDATALRAVDARGATADLSAKIQAETRAWLQRHRQIHPSLMRALDRMNDDGRIPILAWIFHEHELPRKEERGEQPLLVASRETSEPGPRRPGDLPADSYTEALRASVRETLDRARAQFRGIGVEVSADLETVPVLVAEATKAQVDKLSQLPEVTGLYLHEPDGIPDLATSIADARAAATHSAGFKGANIPVAVWEQMPKSTTDLDIEATFDSSAAAGQSSRNREHAQLVTAVIKNTQSSGSKGFAPDAKVFAANKFSNDALAWAVVTKRCHVVNQSFHRASEETDSGLSADDLIKDYLALHPPFPTIVQAAGNGPATEFVNHKGFNSITVGNHEDGASSMRASSVFKNPSSTHNDRELPDLCANGTSVSATGLTKTGTSFASPAVAGSAAVVQSVDGTLKWWPEGCRAILLASAGRNITGGSWSQAATSSTTDALDGSGALDTGEAAQIARVRARRDAAAARRGWDVGTLRTSDLQANGTSSFRYRVGVPASGAKRLKAVLAWSSKVTYTSDSAVIPPVKVTESKLPVDLDLYVYLNGSLVAHSSTFDSSFEIVEFDAQSGNTYEIRIKRFSGTDWVWFGIAWTVI